MFHTSVQPAIEASMARKRPLFVYVTSLENNELENKFLTPTTVSKIKHNFVALKVVKGTADFANFSQVVPQLICPSFNIVAHGKLVDVITMEWLPERAESRLTELSGEKQPNQNQSQNQNQYQQQHDLSVSNHLKQVAAEKKAQKEERHRIKVLLDNDRREKESGRKRQVPAQQPQKEHPVPSHTSCDLVIRLLDGKSVKNTFLAEQTLNDVRSWLEEEVEEIVGVSSMPSFATSSNPSPSHYVFHQPGVPRVTFTDTQEFENLGNLGLCPRSVLILKPVYDEKYSTSYPNGRRGSGGLFSSLGGSISRVGHALYSFFDYGLRDAGSAEDIKSKAESEEDAMNEQQQSARNSNTPNVISIDGSRLSSASLINIERKRNEGLQKDDSVLSSRASTPAPAPVVQMSPETEE